MTAQYVSVNGSQERGCGFRVPNGIYATCGLSKSGMPLEFFLVDPPRPIDGLNARPLGVQPLTINGVTHVVDWIGSSHYPKVADFVEEVRHMGLSRRIRSTFPFELLTEDSKMILIHSQARILNGHEYHGLHDMTCPKHNPNHPFQAVPNCICCWWVDFEESDAESDKFMRQRPSFAYEAWRRDSAITPAYEPGIFAIFPLTEIQVVSPTAGSNALTAAQAASVPVKVTED